MRPVQKFVTFLVWIFVLGFSSLQVSAQNVLIGRVVNPSQKPISGVRVSVDGSPFVTSEKDGGFEIRSSKNLSNPSVVVAEKDNYVVQDWGMTGRNRITILMYPKPVVLQGTVVDGQGIPVSKAIITVGGLEVFAVSDPKGKFNLELPINTDLKGRFRFFVNKELITPDQLTLDPVTKTVLLRIDKIIERKEQPKVQLDEPLELEIPAEENEPEALEIDDTNPAIREARDKLRDEFPGVDPVLVVVVFEDNVNPVANATVKVNGNEYQTNERGEVAVYADSVSTAIFTVNDEQVARKIYNFEDNYVFLHIKDTATTNIDLDPVISVEENFQYVFNQLEADKQQLQEKGSMLRMEINKIIQKIDRGVAPEEQLVLEGYLDRLTGSLVENELAYEETLEKTNQIISEMRERIISSETAKAAQQEEVQSQRGQRNFWLAIALLSIALLIFAFLSVRNARQKNKEIEQAYSQLKVSQKEVEKSADEMHVIKNIGQMLTTHLDFENYMLDLKRNINHILPVDRFAIGIFQKDEQIIEFLNVVTDETLIPRYQESVYDTQSLSAWCLLNLKDIIINDINLEKASYADQSLSKEDEEFNSVMFFPLLIRDEPLGVMTIQARHKNAFKGVKVGILKTLSSYAAIAISNRLTYQQLEKKNELNSNSIRYAQIMQNNLLPKPEQLDALSDDAFLIYKPKNKVSGDFYWTRQVKGRKGEEIHYVCVADCTGSGVQSALLCNLTFQLLNKIIEHHDHTNLADLLDQLNKEFIALIGEGTITETREQVDLSIVKLVKEQNQYSEASYVGVRRPVHLAKAELEVLEELPGDMKTIGYSAGGREKVYTERTIYFDSGDMLYLSTNGYTDQQNPGRQKFGNQSFRDLLQEIMLLDADLQKEHLERHFKTFKGEADQRDDVTILGFRLS